MYTEPDLRILTPVEINYETRLFSETKYLFTIKTLFRYIFNVARRPTQIVPNYIIYKTKIKLQFMYIILLNNT